MTGKNPEDNKKVINIRKKSITFVTAIFVFLGIYMLIQAGKFMSKKSIRAYTVNPPSSDTVGQSYTGIILRDEKTYHSEGDGYLSYYVAERDKVKPETVLLSLDKDGDMEVKLHKLYYGQTILSADSRLKIQGILRQSVKNYDSLKFQNTMVSKGDLQATIFSCLLKDGGEEFEKILSEYSLSMQEATETGFMVSWQDGYEESKPEDIRLSDFNQDEYKRQIQSRGSYVHTGDFVYKLIHSNQFQLVFRLSSEDVYHYGDRKSLDIRMDNGVECTGKFEMIKNGDGDSFGVITMEKYGYSLLDTRFLSFQILDKSVFGYKIPETAITTKEFFVVPAAYIQESGEKGSKGVIVRDEKGDHFVETTVYQSNGSSDTNFVIGEDSAYIFSEELKSGTVIVGNATDENGKHEEMTMKLLLTAKCEGIYQINNGYCIFKPILRVRNSIDSSYVIISSKTKSDLKSYDRIVLDVSDISESEFIFD